MVYYEIANKIHRKKNTPFYIDADYRWLVSDCMFVETEAVKSSFLWTDVAEEQSM